MKQKKVIVIAVALIAVVLIVAGTAAALLYGGDSYASKVEDGYRYLEEGDFNNAILMFRRAIEEDGSREDAYYGLYQAYARSGQNDYATITLRMGVEATNSESLRGLLEQVNAAAGTADQTVQQTPAQDDQAQQLDDKDIVTVLNTDLLSVFASATYGDYVARYSGAVGSLSNGQYTMYLDSVGATLVFHDSASQRVIDTGRGVPYTEYLPNEIRMDNITSLFGGVSRLTFDTLKNLSGVADASQSGNTITFSYSGCQVTIICAEEGVITADSENYLVPSATGAEVKTEYVLAASVKDATTGLPVSGAKVRVYEGYNTFGDAVEGETDYAGNLNLDLVTSGTYTVVIEKTGYITENFEVFIMSSMAQTQETFTISPTISGDGIRFVLSWGASPSDLDSYLVGTASDGTNVNVNFTNMQVSNSQGTKIAELDVDDVSSYGPETTTLYDTTGSYEFYVDDFTNSGTISTSGATVKIYVGSSLYATVTIPGGIEDMWHVCTITDGQIMVTNRAY